METLKDKLTTEELNHLAEDAGVTDLEGFKQTIKYQREQAAKLNALQSEAGLSMMTRPVCWDCHGIAKKLGI